MGYLLDVDNLLNGYITDEFKSKICDTISFAIEHSDSLDKSNEEIIGEILNYNLENKLQEAANELYLKLPEKYSLKKHNFNECADIISDFISHCAISETFEKRSIIFEIGKNKNKFNFIQTIIEIIAKDDEMFNFKLKTNKERSAIKLTLTAK